jgi:Zn finger protein HypA/HybF involved in hydrogenase expression
MVLVKRKCFNCGKYFPTTKTLYYCPHCYANKKRVKNDFERLYEE